ncbi:DUF29 domain-containing protein [Nostoc flagelliforme]|uniref:DUF29 domain-containing protein n=1 Tax=Nostoc flagelliforme TaxID=1306274 RepID=UPI0030CF4ECA
MQPLEQQQIQEFFISRQPRLPKDAKIQGADYAQACTNYLTEVLNNQQAKIEHLIEELVDLGKAEKNALKSNLTILLAHLLKLHVQYDIPDNIKGSWYSSILEHRQRVINNLTDTPSLKSFLVEAV